LKHNYKMV